MQAARNQCFSDSRQRTSPSILRVLCLAVLAISLLSAMTSAATPPVPGKASPTCDAVVGGQCYNNGSFTLSYFSAGAHHYKVCRSGNTLSWGGCSVTMTTNTGSSFTVNGSHLPSNGFRRAYYISACDAQNNCTRWGDNPEVYVYTDTQAPSAPGPTTTTCNFVTTGPTNCWVKGNFTISASPASDTGSGVGSYQICRSNNSTGGPAGCNVTMTSNGSTSFPVSGSHLPTDGFRRAYRFKAKDRVGNLGNWNTPLYVRRDRHNPTVSASNASSTWFSSRNAVITAADATAGAGANSGLTQVRYRWNAAHNGSCSTGTLTSNGAILTVPVGDNHLHLCAKDNVGRVGFWNGGPYRVDNVSPVQNSLTISNNVWVIDHANNYSMTAKVSDTHSGVREIRTLINFQGSNSGNRRGYFSWRHATLGYQWTADRVACAGGGFASKHPTNYNPTTISLVGCSTSVTGTQRRVTFTVQPKLSFGEFGAINDISMWSRDVALNTTGWVSYNLNFSSIDQNDAPNAVNDTGASAPQIPKTLNLTANDTDPEGDAVTLVGAPIVSGPAHGTAIRASSSSVTYTANQSFTGTDSFVYKVTDGNGLFDQATVTVTVTNRKPVAVNDTAATHVNTPVTVNVTANDSDPDGHSVRLITNPIIFPPSNGTAVKVSLSSLTYTPNDGFIGSDSFIYEISDSNGQRARATVTVMVTNNPPVANPDSITTDFETAVIKNVVNNDTDPDGDALTLPGSTIVTPPQHGTATRFNSLRIRYTPDNGFFGTDSFVYKVSDGLGLTDTATVTVTVNEPPEPVVTSVAPDHLLRGGTMVVSVNGTHLDGATVYVATELVDPGDPVRVYPTAELLSINAAGTQMNVRINSTQAGIDGFYNLAVETVGGMDAGQFRVTGPEPVVDFWTPSEAVAGRVHVLTVGGVNLQGANVVPMDAGVRVLDLDNSDDNSLMGLLFVASGSLGSSDIMIDGPGGDIMLPLTMLPATATPSKGTAPIQVSNTGGPDGEGLQILLQEPTFRLPTGELSNGLKNLAAPGNQGELESHADPSHLCLTIIDGFRINFAAVLFSLLDENDDPLAVEILNALVPGSTLRVNTLSVTLSGFLEFEFLFRICETGITDIRFCFRGGVAVMIPAVGGQSFTFDICLGNGGTTINLGAQGFITNQSWSSNSPCFVARDLGGVSNTGLIVPESPSGHRAAEIEMTCCADANISVQIEGQGFFNFNVGGEVAQIRPPCADAQRYDIEVRAFIPFNHVVAPGPPCLSPGMTQVFNFPFRGEERGFRADPGGTAAAPLYRMQQVVSVYADRAACDAGLCNTNGLVPGTYQRGVGRTEKYAEDALFNLPFDVLNEQDRDGVSNDCHLWIDDAYATLAGFVTPTVTRLDNDSVQVFLKAAGNNPLSQGSPDIDWEFTVTLHEEPSRTVFNVSARHDCFPAYEVYINNQHVWGSMPHTDDTGYIACCLVTPRWDVQDVCQGDLGTTPACLFTLNSCL